ncbi:N-acetylmuramic acid 6-phosphate etherase [Cutibacterium sp. WCA-380-WT-3A]|uniref:N-acetylmuramic acid 6-phosphate etherase n=1 Tax=Cutibacterium porci TaxID=2605781 RepID=A0A7K0J6E7_9ACTN|nr:N-acetylmuramic acid 6-phosphate etherase [Cutibacterium porci]MSS45514.1 N-acetylmuramic acid 6-phosphate etherase [Cutibacterium porci]
MDSLTNLATTEGRNPASEGLDQLSTLEMLRVMNDEDHRVPDTVASQLSAVAAVVEAAVRGLSDGGRLIYAGAGTSGRLGVLDAVECPPTFSTDPTMVVGLIAGGRQAMFQAVEGAEDDADRGVAEMNALQPGHHDVVVGLTASGRTPWVVGAVRAARRAGAVTAAVSCNRGAAISSEVELPIEIDAGPEVLTGSTRLKAGTVQKLVLNMISTATMVKLGKTYGNLMVDVAPNNEKLRQRAVSIVMTATGCSREDAMTALREADWHAKTAIVMVLMGMTAAQARSRLAIAGGAVRTAVDENYRHH